MTHLDLLGTIKGVTLGALKLPGAIVGTAKSVITGHHPEQHHEAAAPAPTDVAPEPTVHVDPDEPVNVTEELGLDPAPVAKPKKRPRQQDKPVTGIDAAADPADVDVTPADIAEVVAPRTDGAATGTGEGAGDA